MKERHSLQTRIRIITVGAVVVTSALLLLFMLIYLANTFKVDTDQRLTQASSALGRQMFTSLDTFKSQYRRFSEDEHKAKLSSVAIRYLNVDSPNLTNFKINLLELAFALRVDTFGFYFSERFQEGKQELKYLLDPVHRGLVSVKNIQIEPKKISAMSLSFLQEDLEEIGGTQKIVDKNILENKNKESNSYSFYEEELNISGFFSSIPLPEYNSYFPVLFSKNRDGFSLIKHDGKIYLRAELDYRIKKTETAEADLFLGFFIFEQMIKNEYWSSFAKEHGVLLGLYDSKGDLLFKTDDSIEKKIDTKERWLGVHSANDSFGNGYRVILNPIYFNDSLLGFTALKISNKFLRNKLFMVTMVVSLTTVGIIVLMVFVTLYLGNKVARPIRDLSRLAEQLSQGEHNYNLFETFEKNNSSKKHGFSFDEEVHEVAGLKRSFKKMVEAISERDRVLRDYNENLEQILQRRTRELETERSKSVQASKLSALGEMAAGIAHEINNPLAAISGFCSLGKGMIERNQADHTKLVSYFERINGLVHRATKIINGLRNFAREGSLDEKAMLNISELFESSLSLLAERFKNYDILLACAEIDRKLEIYGSSIHLSQIIVNLLSNAFDVLNELPNRDDKWAKIEMETDNEYFYFIFSNGGEKINEEIASKLFQPFFTTKPIGKGTGLGLSISKGLAAAHKGDLYIDMNKKETTFVLKIPKV